jgi:hypothetical protein
MMPKPAILLIGAGGHCKACIDVIEQSGQWQIAGIVDRKGSGVEDVLGYPVIGCDEDLPRLRQEFDYAFVTVGQLGTAELKIKLFNHHARQKIMASMGRVKAATKQANSLPAAIGGNGVKPLKIMMGTCAHQGRTWPVPCTKYLKLVSCSTPTGPRACILPVAMPISAPMPNSPPSAN